MSENLIKYIEDMKARGYSIPQIKQALLKQYPLNYVDSMIRKVEMPKPDISFDDAPSPDRNDFSFHSRDSSVDVVEQEDADEERPSFLEKIVGILFSPKKIFSRLKNEDMIHTFKIYALFMIVFGVIAFLISLFGLFKIVPILGSGLILLPIIYFCLMLLWSLLMPFLFVAYHYLFLKLIFNMKKSYDQCYKAIVYAMLQIMIFYVLLIPLVFILSLFSSTLSGAVILILTVVLVIYNLITQIQGLSTLCEVEKYKAVIVVLFPIALALLIVIAGIFFLESIFTSLLGGISPMAFVSQLPT